MICSRAVVMLMLSCSPVSSVVPSTTSQLHVLPGCIAGVFLLFAVPCYALCYPFNSSVTDAVITHACRR
jgi:hypothetical protein